MMYIVQMKVPKEEIPSFVLVNQKIKEVSETLKTRGCLALRAGVTVGSTGRDEVAGRYTVLIKFEYYRVPRFLLSIVCGGKVKVKTTIIPKVL